MRRERKASPFLPLVVSLDIAKLFDGVWHKALFSKLPSYRLPEKLCGLYNIKLVVGGVHSDPKRIDVGVPKGC